MRGNTLSEIAAQVANDAGPGLTLATLRAAARKHFRNMAVESRAAINAAASGWSEEKKARYTPEMMRQRGELKRLARDICKLPKAEEYARRHNGEIEADAIESIVEASAWLAAFASEYRKETGGTP